MIAGQLALAAASVFAGAALYVSFVEHPARAHLDDQSALTEWKPAYKRGFAMQGPLAVAGFLFGLLAWWQSASLIWLLGALVLIANWPYTLLVILPTNNALMAMAPAQAGSASHTLLERWGKLHDVRSALGCIAAAIFLVASLR
jgi:hypothetical protein